MMKLVKVMTQNELNYQKKLSDQSVHSTLTKPLDIKLILLVLGLLLFLVKHTKNLLCALLGTAGTTVSVFTPRYHPYTEK